MMESLFCTRQNKGEQTMESIAFGLGMVSGAIICVGIETIVTQ